MEEIKGHSLPLHLSLSRRLDAAAVTPWPHSATTSQPTLGMNSVSKSLGSALLVLPAECRIILPHWLLSSSGLNTDSHLLTSLAWLLCLQDVTGTAQHHEELLHTTRTGKGQSSKLEAEFLLHHHKFER